MSKCNKCGTKLSEEEGYAECYFCGPVCRECGKECFDMNKHCRSRQNEN